MLKALTPFVDEYCLVARNARYPALDLYLTSVSWCLQNGVPVQDPFPFIEVLEGYGSKYRERKRGAWFRGITVLPGHRIDLAESHG